MCQTRLAHLKSNNILCTNQFGLGKNSNTSDAIIEFLDYVYSSLESKQSTIAVYLDFSKAFDTVNHNIVMSKLLHNGVRGVMQHWFESYLTNRKQYVSIRSCNSSMSNITLSVPQGSVLAQYSFFCISMTFIDPQIRFVLFILLMIRHFLHPTVTLTMSMPL